MRRATAVPARSASRPGRVTRRGKVLVRILALIWLAVACRPDPSPIPFVDGPLVLEIRYPSEEPIAVADSVSVWGSVGNGRARLLVNGRRVRVEPNGAFAAFVELPRSGSPALHLEARLGDSVVRRTVAITRATHTPRPQLPVRSAGGWVRLRRLPNDTLDAAGQTRPVYSRWTPGGALALPLPLGVRLPVEAETDDALRLRLALGVSVWIARVDAEPVAPRTPETVAVGGLSVTAGRLGPVVEIAAAEQLASHVEAIPGLIRWTLFGAVAGPAAVAPSTGAVRRAGVRSASAGQVVIDLELAGPVLGWRTTWHDGRMRLELRPEPVVRQLEGLVVALDPGHPPLGSIGPAGLREDSVTLAVAREAARRLAALGARPILTREDAGPVSLEQRLALAEAADAQVFVSIHLNAPGDGRPPESVDGTRVYWLHPRTQPLAWVLRDSVAAALRQVPVATVQSNLAVLRATWFPAVLVEGTALSLPAREALFRTPEGVAAYAAGLVGGLRAWVAAPP